MFEELRMEQHFTYRGTTIQMMADFSLEITVARKK